MDYFGRLLNRDNQVVVAEHSIELQTVEKAIRAYDIPAVDFIKLDVEGAEVDILKGSVAVLRATSLLGILSEVRFHREINGSPPFYELDALVNGHGFRLFDLQFHHQSRHALPYPGLCDYRMPSGQRFFAYTTHGQIQDGDALYFRDLMIEQNRAVAENLSCESLLKLCALFEIYSLNDCAAELIVAYADRLKQKIECSKLLDLLATEMTSRKMTYDRYMNAYFDDRKRSPNSPAHVMARRMRMILSRIIGGLR